MGAGIIFPAIFRPSGAQTMPVNGSTARHFIVTILIIKLYLLK